MKYSWLSEKCDTKEDNLFSSANDWRNNAKVWGLRVNKPSEEFIVKNSSVQKMLLKNIVSPGGNKSQDVKT